jgi:hypothetical protein
VATPKHCGYSQILWLLPNTVTSHKHCGYSQTLWLLRNTVTSLKEKTVATPKHCGYSQTLWLLPSTVATPKHCGYVLVRMEVRNFSSWRINQLKDNLLEPQQNVSGQKLYFVVARADDCFTL